MIKKTLLIPFFSLFALVMLTSAGYAKGALNIKSFNRNISIKIDTIPPADVMEVVSAVINATNDFSVQAVADLYTPNAVVADDEPPYSWNGPTAGVQWVNAVEKACKDNRITKLKGTILAVNVYQQNADNTYIVIPVSYTGNLPGKAKFAVKGAFTFVLRQVNGKWMIKSQVWMSDKAM